MLAMNKLHNALKDANRAVELDPKWAKGYRRKASVLEAMKRYREALLVFEEVIDVIQVDDCLSVEAKKKEEDEVTKMMIGWCSCVLV